MNPRAAATALACLIVLTSIFLHPAQQPTEASSTSNNHPQNAKTAQPVFGIVGVSTGSGNITDQNMLPGSSVEVAVTITNAPKFDQYAFDLVYNYEVLQVKNSTLTGTVFSEKLLPETNVVTVITGRVEASVYGAQSFSGNWSLLFLFFRIMKVSLSILSLSNTSLSLNGTATSHSDKGGCFNNRPPKPISINYNTDPTPNFSETSQFMIGTVTVGIVLPESQGPRYNWTDTEVNQTVAGIKAAMNWWATQAPQGSLNFTYETHVLVPTVYEPITMPFYNSTWIVDVMSNLGYSGDVFASTRAFDNHLRTIHHTDWAFTIFVVDNGYRGFQNRTDYAYAQFAGPYLVMARYSTFAWGSSHYSTVVPAHETGHIFGATDEYDSHLEYGGYLWTPDVAYSAGVMNNNDLSLSASSKAQIGLIDCNADGKLDLIEQKPVILLNTALVDLQRSPFVVSGQAIAAPYPTYHPGARDITIAKIVKVEYQIDAGESVNATSVGGVSTDAVEAFSFTIPTLSIGAHTIQIQAIDSFGNIGTGSFLVHVTA